MKVEKEYWLINLRWIAAMGVVGATFFSVKIFGIPLPEPQLYIIAASLFVLNLTYLIVYQNRFRANLDKSRMNPEGFIFIQIMIDLLVLTFLLHFAGGVENPFIIYYVFHLMIASILLSKRKSYLVATITVFFVGIMTIGEYSGFFTHYQLKGFLTNGFYHEMKYLAGTGFIFITTSYVVVYLTTTVSDQLKRKEEANRLANIELGENGRIKNEYVYRITHDIKGHLSAIKNCLDVVILQPDKTQQQEFTERAHSRTLKLITFIQDLLKITELKMSGNPEMENIPVHELISEAAQNIQGNPAHRNISLAIKIDPGVRFIYGNRLLLLECLSAILSNSVKFSYGNTHISVIATSVSDGIKIEINDKGIGIPEKEIPGIFNEFYRAGNVRGKENDSNGLGLTIVKHIAELHSGRISVTSKINEGTSVSLIFPLTPHLPDK